MNRRQSSPLIPIVSILAIAGSTALYVMSHASKNSQLPDTTAQQIEAASPKAPEMPALPVVETSDPGFSWKVVARALPSQDELRACDLHEAGEWVPVENGFSWQVQNESLLSITRRRDGLLIHAPTKKGLHKALYRQVAAAQVLQKPGATLFSLTQNRELDWPQPSELGGWPLEFVADFTIAENRVHTVGLKDLGFPEIVVPFGNFFHIKNDELALDVLREALAITVLQSEPPKVVSNKQVTAELTSCEPFLCYTAKAEKTETTTRSQEANKPSQATSTSQTKKPKAPSKRTPAATPPSAPGFPDYR